MSLDYYYDKDNVLMCSDCKVKIIRNGDINICKCPKCEKIITYEEMYELEHPEGKYHS